MSEAEINAALAYLNVDLNDIRVMKNPHVIDVLVLWALALRFKRLYGLDVDVHFSRERGNENDPLELAVKAAMGRDSQ